MRLLIFKFVQLGDNVLFVPVVEALRAQRPDWNILLLTTPREAPLYRGVLSESQLLTSTQARFNSCWKRPWEFFGWLRRLRAFKPDACLISYDQGNAAHLLARASGAGLRVGARIAHVRFPDSVTHDVQMPASHRVVDWHWAMLQTLLRATGSRAMAQTPPRPDLRHLAGEAHPWPEHSQQLRIVVHAGSNQAITRWPLENFAALATSLARDHEVLWIDRPETAGINLPGTVGRFAPDTLGDLVTVLSQADLFVGNNSGPMHVANALGLPGVVVSGPSDTAWDPYWNPGDWQLLRRPGLACLPCEWSDRYRLVRACTNLMEPMACMNYWSVEAVLERVLATCGLQGRLRLEQRLAGLVGEEGKVLP